MNTAQISAMRKVYESMNRRPMTAREMALTSHKLSKDGDTAKLRTGERYAWDTNKNMWHPV